VPARSTKMSSNRQIHPDSPFFGPNEHSNQSCNPVDNIFSNYNFPNNKQLDYTEANRGEFITKMQQFWKDNDSNGDYTSTSSEETGSAVYQDHGNRLDSHVIAEVDHFPEQVVIQGQKHKAWMSEDILEMMKTRDRFYRDMKRQPNSSQKSELYKKARNAVVALTREAKKQYELSAYTPRTTVQRIDKLNELPPLHSLDYPPTLDLLTSCSPRHLTAKFHKFNRSQSSYEKSYQSIINNAENWPSLR